MTTLRRIERAAALERLQIFGHLYPDKDDPVPPGTGTVLLLGPAEPGFWAHVSRQPEFADGSADPLDRWSKKVIEALAGSVGGIALFPFTGPPWLPFISWAQRSGRAWQSPVSLLVHETAGLFLSYRGALAIRDRLDIPEPTSPRPCDSCEARPCLQACPVFALTETGYDLAACHGFLDRPSGQECMSSGCAVRRACPVSQAYGRLPEQSAFHMRRFH